MYRFILVNINLKFLFSASRTPVWANIQARPAGVTISGRGGGRLGNGSAPTVPGSPARRSKFSGRENILNRGQKRFHRMVWMVLRLGVLGLEAARRPLRARRPRPAERDRGTRVPGSATPGEPPACRGILCNRPGIDRRSPQGLQPRPHGKVAHPLMKRPIYRRLITVGMQGWPRQLLSG